MALGLSYSSGAGGEILPFVKYDARAGKFFRNDRTESNGEYSSDPVDITSTFKAVMDLENLEVGYCKFGAGVAPEFLLVKLGDPMPQKPADPNFKQGARLMMKLHASCGGDVREMTSNAAAFLKGLDELHNRYEAEKAAHLGKLPVVSLQQHDPKDNKKGPTILITSGSGSKKTTNYQPVFEITGWAPRPADLVHVPRSNAKQPPVTTAATPPATGSTQVAAPKAAKQPAMVDDDFG